MRRKERGTRGNIEPRPTWSKFVAEPNHYQSYEFAPRQPLDGKHNVGRHLFIEPDGSLKEVVRLNVLNDRHREDIIAYHFCMQYAKLCYEDSLEKPEFYIVGRDDPWDYRYVMHDGSRFNVEICRVASSQFLKLLKAENDCSLLLMKEQLHGYEIRKIERHFPGTFDPELVESVAKPDNKRRLFKHKVDFSKDRAFLRPPFNPRVDVKEAVAQAIRKKLSKRNSEKEETHLILDNLTTHATASDFFEAYSAHSDELESMSFLSVWLYTGYYSDDDGNNCEFALTPIKISGDLEEKLHYLLESMQLRKVQ